LYVETFDAMGISRSKLHTSISPFLAIISGMRAYPLGNIDQPVMFGDHNNFHTKTQIFEVVDFEGSYHAILGRLCYAKFMAVPNYTYLKLKMPGPNGVITMPGPNGVITVSGSFEQAYAYGWEHFELATTITNSTELKRLHETVMEDAPVRNEPIPSSTFRLTKDTKAIGVDPKDPTKIVWVGAQLPAK
jgi:hypothetical protein